MFIIILHVEALNVSLHGGDKQWKCVLQAVSQQDTHATENNGVMLGG